MGQIAVVVARRARSARRPGRSRSRPRAGRARRAPRTSPPGRPPLTASVNAAPIVRRAAARGRRSPPPRARATAAASATRPRGQVLTPASPHGRRTACAWPTAPCSRTARCPATRNGRYSAVSQHRRRHALVDRGDGRPPALTRIRHAAAELLELGRLVERDGRQVEQPGRDDAAAPPDLGDRGDVDVVHVELRIARAAPSRRRRRAAACRRCVLEDVQPLGVRRHQPVLDAVVHHLHEVPGAVRPAVQVAELLRRRVAAAPGVRSAPPTPGAIVAKSGSSRANTSSSAPIIRQKPRSRPEDAAAGADVDVVDALAPAARRPGGCRRGSTSCRRR